MTCFLQGTEFLMQVPVSLSTSSTMTKGFSSSVTMDRWLSSSSASPKELKRGHTGYLRERLRLSSFPIWRQRQKKRLPGEEAEFYVPGPGTCKSDTLETDEKFGSQRRTSLARCKVTNFLFRDLRRQFAKTA